MNPDKPIVEYKQPHLFAPHRWIAITVLFAAILGLILLLVIFVVNKKPSSPTTGVTQVDGNFKTYTDSRVGISFTLPNNWKVDFKERSNAPYASKDLIDAVLITPYKDSTTSASIYLPIDPKAKQYDIGTFYVGGLNHVATFSAINKDKNYDSFASGDLNIDGRAAKYSLRTPKKDGPIQPWCDCSYKDVFIENNKKIITIRGTWPNSDSQFLEQFDKFIESIKFK